MDNNNNEVLQYLKNQEKSRILTDVIIKIILSTIAVFEMMKTMPLNFTNVLVGGIVFAFVYDVCCIYQFSLRLTCNHIVAFFVAVAILGGCFELYNMVISKLGWKDKQCSLMMEYIFVIVVIIVLLVPLMINIWSIIKLSK